MSKSENYVLTLGLFEELSDKIIYDEMGEEEALQAAVDWAFRDYNDEFRADLFSKIWERWQEIEIEMRFVDTQSIIGDARG